MSMDCLDQALREEFAKQVTNAGISPGLYLSRTGSLNNGTWLLAGDRFSNIVGIPFGYKNGRLTRVIVANEQLTTFSVEIYHHLGDETALTLLTTVTVNPAATIATFRIAEFGEVLIPENVQIACKVSGVSGQKPRNAGVYITALGN